MFNYIPNLGWELENTNQVRDPGVGPVLQIQQMVTGGQELDCSCGRSCWQLHQGNARGSHPQKTWWCRKPTPDAVAGHCQGGMVSAGCSAERQPRNTNVEWRHDLGTTVWCVISGDFEVLRILADKKWYGLQLSTNEKLGHGRMSHQEKPLWSWCEVSPGKSSRKKDSLWWGHEGKILNRDMLLHLACVLCILKWANIYIFYGKSNLDFWLQYFYIFRTLFSSLEGNVLFQFATLPIILLYTQHWA